MPFSFEQVMILVGALTLLLGTVAVPITVAIINRGNKPKQDPPKVESGVVVDTMLIQLMNLQTQSMNDLQSRVKYLQDELEERDKKND